MITIDRLSFGFTMNDESFAHHLYANWDEFCRDCFEKVVDECLSAYDKQKILMEIDELDLDLGPIPEEEFYRQFPIRLREELLRRWHVSGNRKEREIWSWEKRLENLLHYLEYGFCYAEWADADFDVGEELEGLMEHLPQRIDELLDFCFGREHVLERLVRQTDDGVFVRFVVLWNKYSGISVDEKCRTLARLSVTRPDLIAAVLVKLQQRQNVFLKMVSRVDIGLQSDRFLSPLQRSRIELSILEYLPELLRRPLLTAWKENMLWLSSAAISQYEKRRYLGILLDSKPEIPVRFIHETREEGDLDKMAEILDSVVVRQIMITESESHAEVDIPAYWHYLYDWLIKYYPFNGVAIFGSKQQFQKHLNRRLLTFIRRRNYTAYLAKAELTLQFLLEVFGHEYYLVVLAEIYRQQSRNPDGSPVYTGYFNMELFRIFLKLSLLRQPALPDTIFDFQKLTVRLTDTRIRPEERREILRRMLGEQTAAMRKWLSMALKDGRTAALLAELVDTRLMLELVAIASFYAVELFSQVEKLLRENKKQILWLSGLNENELSFAIRKSMLVWMGRYELSEGQTYIKQYMRLLYSDVVGGTDGNEVNEAVAEAVRVVSDRLQWTEYALEEHAISSLDGWIKRLEDLLKDSAISVLEKRRIFTRWMESYQGQQDRMILAFVRFIQACPTDAETIRLLSGMADFPMLLQVIAIRNLSRAEVLAQICEWLQRRAGNFPVIGTTGKPLSELLTEVLLSFLLSGTEVSEKSISPHELIRWFVLYVYRISTGQTHAQDIGMPEWKQLENRMAEELGFDSKSAETEYKEKLPANFRVEDIAALLHPRQHTAIFQRYLATILEHYPEQFFAFIKDNADEEIGEKLAECTDRLLLEKWLEVLAACLSPATSKVWRKYAKALILLDDPARKIFVRTLFHWIKKSGWKDETPEQMVASLFRRQELVNLIGNMNLSDQEIEGRDLLFRNRSMAELAAYLTNPGISDTNKQYILRLYIGNQPERALELVRLFISRQTVPMGLWTQWLDEKDCLQLLAALSVSQAEIVQQVMDYLSEKQIVGTETLRNGLIRYLVRIIETRRMQGNTLEIVRQFISDLHLKIGDVKKKDNFLKGNADLFGKENHFSEENGVTLETDYDSLKEKKELSEKDGTFQEESKTVSEREGRLQEKKGDVSSQENLPEEPTASPEIKNNLPEEDIVLEELLRNIKTDLSIGDREENVPDESQQEPEYTVVSNAGLVLLAPWLSRLFGSFGLLTKDKRNFIDIEARKRAIFMLQYLVYSEEKEYRESELAFNRVLVNCSFHVSLPKRLALTDDEKKTLDGMLIGIKANWPKMKNTSVQGLQTSFIQRNGRLEQTEEKWMLTVEKKMYDILLDCLPWAFEVVRFPWLKKQIYVDWHTKKN